MERFHPRIGDPAVLDQRAGAHLRLASAAAKDRRDQPVPPTYRNHQGAAGARPQHLGHRGCDRAYPAAVHGPAAIRHHAEDPERSDPGRSKSWRQPIAHLLADLPAAIATRHSRRRDLGVRAVSGLLHHT